MSLFPRISSSLGQPNYHNHRSHNADNYSRELSPFFNLFNDTFSELQRLSDSFPVQSMSFTPKFDVKETKDTYELQGELPGIKQEDVNIELNDDNTLIIKGKTEHRREEGSRPSQQQQQQQQQEGQGQGQAQAQGKSTEAADNDANKASDSTQVATTTTTGRSTEVSKHQPQQPQQQHTYWVSERSVGEFARSFQFPQRVDKDNIKASLKSGILTIVVPKLTKQSSSRRVTVEAE